MSVEGRATPRIFTSTKTKQDQRSTETECLRLVGFFQNARPRDVLSLVECGLVEPASVEAAAFISGSAAADRGGGGGGDAKEGGEGDPPPSC